MQRLALLAAVLCQSALAAPTLLEAKQARDGKTVEYRVLNGTTRTVQLLRDQVRLTNVQVSEDRAMFGWLAEYSTCCTSYPVPLRLEVQAASGRRLSFPATQAVWGWCFVPGRAAVAYRQSATHGAQHETYELRRIGDARLLARFNNTPGETATVRSVVSLPSWARCAAAPYKAEASQETPSK